MLFEIQNECYICIMQNKQKKVIKTIRMNVELIEGINNIAERHNRNFTNMVNTILIKYVKDDEQLRTSARDIKIC